MLGISLQLFLIKAIIASALISVSVLGSSPYIAMKGFSFLSVEVAHAILCGAALGILINRTFLTEVIDPLWIALAFSIASGLTAGFLGEKSRERLETAVGVMFALNMALAVLFMGMIPPDSLPRVWGYLIGDLFLLTENDMAFLITSSTMVGLSSLLFSKEFVYISFDEEGAIAHGLNARFYHYLMILMISIATVSAVKAVGAILAYALMVIPGAVAMEFDLKVREAILLTFILSLTSQITGIILSVIFSLPPGGVIGMMMFAIYLISIFKRAKFSKG